MNTSSNTPNRQPKYRPVLSALQIKHILALAKRENPLSDLSLSVISTLSVFQAKIDNAVVVPAYTGAVDTVAKEVQQLMDLGGTPATPSTPSATTLGVDKEAYWEQCYKLYTADPASCSLAQLQGATEWRYLNDLMTPEEEAAYENTTK